MRCAGITICLRIMSPNASMAPLGSRANRPSISWGQRGPDRGHKLLNCLSKPQRDTSARGRNRGSNSRLQFRNRRGRGGRHAAGAPASSCLQRAHLLVGDLVAALVGGDGAADLGQHVVAVLQRVAGGVAVRDLRRWQGGVVRGSATSSKLAAACGDQGSRCGSAAWPRGGRIS